ncbi:MAG: ribosome biogenesis GTPase Der [Chitinophagaceae bacterium]|nr:ribosome biogenesis GTPase Der [Chitinophagaceae bacterium]
MAYTVAIVGRPNVGKSTFFNRMLGKRKAIVDDQSGVTRDRQYGVAEWTDKTFDLIDTGGFVEGSSDVFEREIRKQVLTAIEESNAIIFITDVTTGITGPDNEVADLLRRSEKPVYLVVNKVDNYERQLDAAEFYSLGFEKVFYVSAISGSGTGELLDEIVKNIPETPEVTESPLPKFAIIGQPNVGKSSLLNSLIGKERTIVSDIAGTTRDAVHTHYNQFGKEFILIDTAGLRRKKKVGEDLEFYSVIRAVRAMDEADVCIMLIDAVNGISAQDLNIYSMAAKKGKGIVLLVNKWDLIEKETNTMRDYEKQLRKKLAPFNDVPILFTSATEKTRIFQAVEAAIDVYEKRKNKIPTSKLNEVIQKALESYRPPVYRGNAIKIKYVTQLPTPVVSFAFFCNYPEEVKQPYRNYLENKLRENFDLTGVPVRLFFRKK